MPVNVSKGQRGPDGKARVMVNTVKDEVVVKFMDGEEAGFEQKFFLSDVKFPLKTGIYNVRLNGDRTEIWSARPAQPGDYAMKFKGFFRDDTGVIRINAVDERSGISNGKPWKIPAHTEFIALLEIVSESDYMGLVIAYNMIYCFRQFQDTQDAEIGGTGMNKVLSFLQSAGMNFATDTITMGTPPQLLAGVEKLLISRDAIFTAKLDARGYITEVSALPADIVRMYKEKLATVQPAVVETQLPKRSATKYTDLEQIPIKDLIKAQNAAASLGIDLDSEEDILKFMNTHQV